MVLDKPAGLPVHRGPRGGASIEDWLEPLRMGRRHLPQPAHRLDTDTAGCLVLGRTKPALGALGRIFAAGQADKTYWAVLRGGPAEDDGVIDAPLRKTSSAARGWRMEVHPEGQRAVTHWRVLGRGAGLTWVEFRPETGRTHQLRVHAAAQGWPILGDPLYGEAAPGRAAPAGAGHRPAARPAAGRHRAGAAAHAGGAARLRMGRRYSAVNRQSRVARANSTSARTLAESSRAEG